jgi:hypothetical protein
VQAAFAEEQIRGLELAARVRIVALAVVSVWVAIENDFPEAWYPFASIVGFATTQDTLGVAFLELLAGSARAGIIAADTDLGREVADWRRENRR